MNSVNLKDFLLYASKREILIGQGQQVKNSSRLPLEKTDETYRKANLAAKKVCQRAAGSKAPLLPRHEADPYSMCCHLHLTTRNRDFEPTNFVGCVCWSCLSVVKLKRSLTISLRCYWEHWQQGEKRQRKKKKNRSAFLGLAYVSVQVKRRKAERKKKRDHLIPALFSRLQSLVCLSKQFRLHLECAI